MVLDAFSVCICISVHIWIHQGFEGESSYSLHLAFIPHSLLQSPVPSLSLGLQFLSSSSVLNNRHRERGGRKCLGQILPSVCTEEELKPGICSIAELLAVLIVGLSSGTGLKEFKVNESANEPLIT